MINCMKLTSVNSAHGGNKFRKQMAVVFFFQGISRECAVAVKHNLWHYCPELFFENLNQKFANHGNENRHLPNCIP